MLGITISNTHPMKPEFNPITTKSSNGHQGHQHDGNINFREYNAMDAHRNKATVQSGNRFDAISKTMTYSIQKLTSPIETTIEVSPLSIRNGSSFVSPQLSLDSTCVTPKIDGKMMDRLLDMSEQVDRFEKLYRDEMQRNKLLHAQIEEAEDALQSIIAAYREMRKELLRLRANSPDMLEIERRKSEFTEWMHQKQCSDAKEQLLKTEQQRSMLINYAQSISHSVLALKNVVHAFEEHRHPSVADIVVVNHYPTATCTSDLDVLKLLHDAANSLQSVRKTIGKQIQENIANECRVQ